MKAKERYTDYTKVIRESLPTWMAMRNEDSSVGAKFLKSIGMQMDDMDWYLSYAYEQLHINSADIEQVDTIYKAEVGRDVLKSVNYFISIQPHNTRLETSLKKFLEVSNETGEYGILKEDSEHYIDMEKGYVYFKHPYGVSPTNPYGVFELVLEENDREILRESYPMQVHRVWNFFDEFGLLLGVERIVGEKNKEYKNRILNVFRRPAGSDKEGLVNGIARELGLIKTKTWENPAHSIVLNEERIVVESIKVDGWMEPTYEYDDSGRLILLPLKGAPRRARVEYIVGLEIEEMHETEVQESLYDKNGEPTEKMKRYLSLLRTQVPVFWGQWKWDEGFWQKEGDMEVQYLPTVFDANFESWSKVEGRNK